MRVQRPRFELADESGLRFQNTPGTERGFGIGAAIDQGAGAVEHIEMALRRAGDGEARGAGGREPAIEPLEGGSVAGRHRVDRLVDRVGRRIADHGADVVERDLATALGIQAELRRPRRGSPCGRCR